MARMFPTALLRVLREIVGVVWLFTAAEGERLLSQAVLADTAAKAAHGRKQRPRGRMASPSWAEG